MHLKKVTLNNFRCFENLTLDLHPRLTVLVAENGGGKTAVLDGIAIGLSSVLRVLSSANQRLSGPGIRDTDFLLKAVRGTKNTTRVVTSDFAQVVLETVDGLVWDKWRPATKGKHPEVKIGHGKLDACCIDLLESLATPTPKLLPVFAYYGARRGWIVIPERLRGAKVNYDQPTAALFGALDDLTDFRELVNWLYQEDAAEARANRDAGDDFEEFSSLAAVRAAISALLGDTYANPHFNRQHKLVIESSTGPTVLQVAQLSQGYQSMLALAMDFARRLALANSHLTYYPSVNSILEEQQENFPVDLGGSTEMLPPPLYAPAIMLVDEIDLHLHPAWQQRVLGDLIRAFPLTQFIVTTHSPQVLTTVLKESIRILEMDNGEPRIRVPVHETYAQESRSTLEDVLDTPSRPPLDMTRNLQRYLDLVEDGQEAIPQARQLRDELEQSLGAGDSQLQLADMLIARNQAKRKAKA